MKAKGSFVKQEGELNVTPEEVEGFKKSLVPGFIKYGVGILSNEVEFVKWKREQEIKLLKKAYLQTLKNRTPIKPISLKVFTPLLESAVLEEDESMQEKWKNLLANAASGIIDVKPVYVEILNELSPIEARLLDVVYNEARTETDYEKRKRKQYSKELVCKHFSLTSEEFDLIIENIFRLNLMQPPGTEGMMFGERRIALRTTNEFELTTLGFIFVKACSEPLEQV